MASYTRITSDDIAKLEELYGLSLGELRPIEAGMANSSFVSNKGFVVTVLDNHNHDTALTMARVVRHVIQSGVVTPDIIETALGSLVGVLGEKYVILKRYVYGVTLEYVDNPSLKKIGEVLALIHRVPPTELIGRHGRRIPDDWRRNLGEKVASDLYEAIEWAESKESLFSTNEVFVHGDLFPDNIIEEAPGGAYVTLDWETATIDSPILDLGIAAVACAKQYGRPLTEVSKALVESYVTEGVSNEQMPLFSCGNVVIAAKYAAVMLAYHRFFRQVIRFPNPEKADIYKELLAFV